MTCDDLNELGARPRLTALIGEVRSTGFKNLESWADAAER
jgi:hypothetical protein